MDGTHLRPEDAFYYSSPPRRHSTRSSSPQKHHSIAPPPKQRSREHRSRSRRRNANNVGLAPKGGKGPWKKLLWVKQNYPDNYTDEETFLDHLQRNPRLRPYEFWPLVADSTIIVQHVCSVVIFVCSFTAIFQDRVSPQTVVGCATFFAVGGWVFRDRWQSRDESSASSSSPFSPSTSPSSPDQLSDPQPQPQPQPPSSTTPSLPSSPSTTSPIVIPEEPPQAEYGMPFLEVPSFPLTSPSPPPPAPSPTPHPYPSPSSPSSSHSQRRMSTLKSALLIYCSLLGLSPILKSLTMSTSSDSIWALSSWLMGINVFTFDYGAGPSAKFPASLSTNAALMASTVLASRLPSTAHVFSLTLFSIEVFGLFPVFRRHLRHHSWAGHVALTVVLVGFAGGGLSMTITGGGWGWGLVGVVMGGLVTGLSMGATSWWLIGLQRYKNEIHGPWDPARPVLMRRGWD